MPIAKGDVGGLDDHLLEANKAYAEILIKSNRKKFNDDITIATFEYISAAQTVESRVAVIETDKVSAIMETAKTQTTEETLGGTK